MSLKDIRDFLDIAKVEGGYGKTSSAIINMLHGINHRGAGNIVPASTDSPGFTFFTKPNLNLSYDNVVGSRRLSYLLSDDSRSMATAIRCMLSPLVGNSMLRTLQKAVETRDGTWNMSLVNDMTEGRKRLPRSDIIDDRMPFIPMLSNSLLNLSGWPDFQIDVYSSKEGLRKEVVSWVDSIGDIYTSFDLNATFRSMEGDPITTLFATWMEYATRVAEGTMVPYANMIIENEIDYQTRIYRFVMDPTRTYIRRTADCGIAYPTAVPTGSIYDYNSDSMRPEASKEISVRFTCSGMRYNDPITVYNFNTLVGIFNPLMRDTHREAMMVKLSASEKRMFNYRGYPRISPDNELEWWVMTEDYTSLIAALANAKTPDATGGYVKGGTQDILSTENYIMANNTTAPDTSMTGSSTPSSGGLLDGLINEALGTIQGKV